MSTKKSNGKSSDSVPNGQSENQLSIIEDAPRVKNKSKLKSEIDQISFVHNESDTLSSKELLNVLLEIKNGNFNVRMPIDQYGINGKICDTMNDIISLNDKMMQEFTIARNTIGKQGKLTQGIRRFFEHRLYNKPVFLP